MLTTTVQNNLLVAQASLPKVTYDHLPVIRGYDPLVAEQLGKDWPKNIDCNRRSKVLANLERQLSIVNNQVLTPSRVTTDQLLTVHTQEYLNLIHSSPSELARHFGLPSLARLNMQELTQGLLIPMQLATGATLLGVETALSAGWAINLSGGFHHAKPEAGCGFCIYADLAIAAKQALTKLATGQKVLIVDLDAHIGDGTAISLANESKVVLIDLYNKDLPHHPVSAKKLALDRIDYYQELAARVTDEIYLACVSKWLDQALCDHNIGFIIFNAGVDIVRGDPVGNMNISTGAVNKRDQLVFDLAINRGIPILITLSGGYGPNAHTIIADSLSNLIRSTKQYQHLEILISINGISTLL